MHHQTIKLLQAENGLTQLQDGINNGSIWKFEGSMGRRAMASLDSGECMLPKKFTFDYYGNKLPSRDVLEKGSKGTFQNSVNYWTNFDEYNDYE